MSSEEKYEGRVDDKLEEIIADIKGIIESKNPRRELKDYSLIAKYEVYRIGISRGGLQDFFEFRYNVDFKTLSKITYHFSDWIGKATREISSRSDEWKILEKIFYDYIKAVRK